MIFLLLLPLAFAVDPPKAPELGAVVEGECSRHLALDAGLPLPSAIADSEGQVTCSGVVIPLSEYAYFLKLQAHVDRIDAHWRIEDAQFRAELHWQELRIVDLSKPPPWLERPNNQRLLGRVETLLTMAAIVGIYAAVSRPITGE